MSDRLAARITSGWMRGGPGGINERKGTGDRALGGGGGGT